MKEFITRLRIMIIEDWQGESAMAVEESKAIIRQWIAARNANDVETAVTFWVEEQQAGLRVAFQGFSESFPDLHVTITDMVGEGEKVAVWWCLEATHRGPFQGIPATSQRITWKGVDLYTVRDHKIVDDARIADNLGLLRQLGAIE
ncbi:MAG: ester cyclase [Caldilineaceae bacterium]